ncbi:MAG: HEAT repeat domain-containing protein [Candidatus Gracilibacteria bacterium]|jgi:HEAT repeat protein
MFESIRQFAIFNKILDVRENEWANLLVAWVLRFLYRIVFVINWTLIVAIFVANIGIKGLPYLFAINALFTILGSIFFSTFLDSIKRETLIKIMVLVSGILFCVAGFMFNISQLAFFSILIVSESIFLIQLKMMLDAFTEDLFTPLSGERIFPIVEASETVGGIIGGILIFALPATLPIASMAFLSVILIFLIFPVLYYYSVSVKKNKFTLSHTKRHLKSPVGIIDKLKSEFSNKRQMSFIKGLAVIVFLQWFVFNLMEFQYTKAVFSKVSSVVMESGSGFEHAFIHDLGILFMLFSVSALIIQCFLGGKIIKSLGVIGSMILHPIVTLVSIVGVFMNFNFYTAVLAKNNFVATSVVYTNAYHSSYYAIKENMREYVREFLDGFVRPIGALLGTLALILFQFFANDVSIVFYLNVFMIITVFVFMYATYLQQEKYTNISLHELNNMKNKEDRLTFIDILAQNGHKDATKELIKILLNEKEDISIKIHILKALAELQDPDALAGLSQCLESKVSVIKEKTLATLLSYKDLRSYLNGNLLLKYELLNFLKKVYVSQRSPIIKSNVIFLLSRISATSAIEFLLNVLNGKDERFKPDAIYALGNYKDSSICEFLTPFLSSKNINQQINAAISLGRTEEFRDEALYHISAFLYSGEKEKVALGLFAVGELKLKKEKAVCFRYLKSKDLNLRMQSAVALLKMGVSEAIPAIVDFKLMKNDFVTENLKYLMRNIDSKLLKNIEKIVKHIVEDQIKNAYLKRELITLKRLYTIVEDYDEVDVVNKLISKKS